MFRTLLISCLLISLGGIASSHPEELEAFFQFFFKVYKNGTIVKLDDKDVKVPASLDSETGVQSKDIVICPETNVSARLYNPKDSSDSKGGRVPLLVYFHGGGFSTGSAASEGVHRFMNSVVEKGKIMAVSVNYRLAPEHFLPIGYDDSWTAIKWVASHAGGDCKEPWLKERVDFNRVYFAGDSAGANIAHNMAMRFGSEKLHGIKLDGIVLIHPYFLLKEPTTSLLEVKEEMRNNVTKLWPYVCPSNTGPSDPRVNPVDDPNLPKLGCKSVLVCLAEKDPLIDAGKKYEEALRKIGGKNVEILVSKEKTHVFQLRQLNSTEALDMLDRIVSFVNEKSN